MTSFTNNNNNKNSVIINNYFTVLIFFFRNVTHSFGFYVTLQVHTIFHSIISLHTNNSAELPTKVLESEREM